MYFKGTPLYPFGYGLSYTTFAYSALRTSARELKADAFLDVDVDLRNTGSRDGEEVVQLYVQHVGSRVSRPERALKAFQRVEVPKGASRTVRLRVAARELGYWDESQKRFVVETGTARVLVGSSSADIRLTGTVRVLGETLTKDPPNR
jgi:beta-glucosidase